MTTAPGDPDDAPCPGTGRREEDRLDWVENVGGEVRTMEATETPSIRTDAQSYWWVGTAPVLSACLLRDRYHACDDKVQRFREQFPDGVLLDADGLVAAINRRGGRGVLWFWNRVLRADQKERIRAVLRGRFPDPWRQLKYGSANDRRAVAEVVAAELRKTGLVRAPEVTP